MICFKCTYTTDSVNHYLLHLKHFHNMQNNDVYKCNGETCERVYNNLNSLRKHLINYHAVKKIDINTAYRENDAS